MWDCEHCGCQAIAGTIEVCPQCGTPRNQEDVSAEPLPSDASAATVAAVADREAPQTPDNEGNWGKPDGKSNG
jgi:hypothetical protein